MEFPSLGPAQSNSATRVDKEAVVVDEWTGEGEGVEGKG